MIQGARSSYSPEKLAKINMPNTFARFGKMKMVKECLVEIDNYCDIQKSQEDDKVFIVVIFLKDFAFE